MKTKHFLLTIPTLAIGLLFSQCGKKRTNMVPPPDTEVQTAVEATFALQCITDIEMVCGFLGVNNLYDIKFYKHSPASYVTATQGTLEPARDNVDKTLRATFVQTKGFDGKLRDGTIYMNYFNQNPDISYYHDYGFVGTGHLAEYKVDGWLIETTGGSAFVVTNQLSSSNFNPRQTKLSWTLEGSFKFTHPSDPAKNMTWNGKITKTLVNTADPAVFTATRVIAIDWTKAVVEYQGQINGTTSNANPYKMVLSSSQPLTRDFTCTPYKIGGVSNEGQAVAWNEEYHPFNAGVAEFTPGNAYKRQVYYGNEGSPQLEKQCDNSGEILIKGVSYKIDFMK